MSSYFIVNHIEDESKKNGIVRASETRAIQVLDEEGQPFTAFQRVHFVHWPDIPGPLEHEEANEFLVFENIYSPDQDFGEDTEKVELFDELKELAESFIEEIDEEQWGNQAEEVQSILSQLASFGEDDEEDEEDEGVDFATEELEENSEA